jgi:hypothetical protein
MARRDAGGRATVPGMRVLSSLLLAPALLAAACDDSPSTGGGPDAAAPPPSARDKMLAAYDPTADFTIRNLSGFQPVGIQLDGSEGFLVTASAILRVDRTAGTSAPIVTASGVIFERLAIDDDQLYIATDRNLYRAPRAGGEAVLLVEGYGNVKALAARDGTLYVLGRESLDKVPTTGGEVTRLATLSSVDEVHFPVGKLLLRDDGIYVASAAQARDGEGLVLRVPYAGGDATPVHRGAYWPYFLDGDHTGIYWTAAGYPDMTSSPPTRLFHLADGATAPVELATVSTAGEFEVNPVGFYWTDHARSAILAVPHDGAGGELTLFETEQPPAIIAADARGLAWTMYDSADAQSVHFMPRAPE